MNKEIIVLTDSLKKNNPAKFLEVVPELLGGMITEKLTNAGIFDNNFSNKVKAELKKDIDKSISSPYNMKRILIGGLIFLMGQYAINRTKSNNLEGGL
jgi:hypothetical protein